MDPELDVSCSRIEDGIAELIKQRDAARSQNEKLIKEIVILKKASDRRALEYEAKIANIANIATFACDTLKHSILSILSERTD